ncbi:hypothetical protein B0H19DRAFT_1073803 [Mycena capillaripes]|nr:hypothetical protein B0H19DRAFT_1073803 [Mycena capillaripes]
MPKAWPKALKPSSQASAGPSQARPEVGLDRAWGSGLKILKPSQASKPLAWDRELTSTETKSWTRRTTDIKYSQFWHALNQALEKVDECYKKTSNSNTYMFAMAKNSVTSRFKKNWSPELQGEAIENMEETFKAQYLGMHAQRNAQTLAPRTKSTTTDKVGLHALTPDDEEDVDGLSETHFDPTKPWCDEYNL